MKKIIPLMLILLISGLLLFLGGCSEPVSKEEEIESPHPDGWEDPSSPNFHAEQISDLSVCAACHGDNFQGGQSGQSCYACHEYPHMTGWASADSHGAAVIAADFDLADCEDCHKTQVGSESTAWDCWSCHVYFPHAEEIEEPKHAGLLRAIGYQVWLCQNCHDADYSGGISGQTCLTCHAYGPEACNTCHGVFNAPANDTASWAPPPNLSGETSTSLMTVGAHRQHVNPSSIPNKPWIGGPWSDPSRCSECHILPATVDAPTHLDASPPQAEISFGPLATKAEEGAISPLWLPETGECSSTYCHGNFELGNPNNPAPVWTIQDGTQIACGTCHLMPPPAPHWQIDNCFLCHSHVVNPDNLTIAYPDSHVTLVEL